MIWLAYVGLLVAAVAALSRLILGPSLADRVIALDLLLISLMSAIAIDAGVTGDTTWLNLLVVIAIIGFTATVASTAFMEREAERAAAIGIANDEHSDVDDVRDGDVARDAGTGAEDAR